MIWGKYLSASLTNIAIQIVIIFQTGDVGLYSIKQYTLQQASVCIFQQHASTVNEVPHSKLLREKKWLDDTDLFAAFVNISYNELKQ